MFLLCLKNPLSANYDVGQNVQSVKIAVGQKFRRSKWPSVKKSVGQNGRRSKWPSVKMAVGQSCVGQKTFYKPVKSRINRKLRVATKIGSTFFWFFN
jgi:hypothetical protein